MIFVIFEDGRERPTCEALTDTARLADRDEQQLIWED